MYLSINFFKKSQRYFSKIFLENLLNIFPKKFSQNFSKYSSKVFLEIRNFPLNSSRYHRKDFSCTICFTEFWRSSIKNVCKLFFFLLFSQVCSNIFLRISSANSFKYSFRKKQCSNIFPQISPFFLVLRKPSKDSSKNFHGISLRIRLRIFEEFPQRFLQKCTVRKGIS